MKRIFVYGFGKYYIYSENVTEKIVRLLKKRRLKNIELHVFPAKFDKQRYLRKLEQHKPDIVIGMGQMPAKRKRKIRIERRAVNIQHTREHPHRKPKPITRGGPKYLYSSLKIPKSKQTRISYNAGNYACNFSMYANLEALQGSAVKYAFIHVPLDADLKAAAGYLESLIKSLQQK